MHFEIDEFLATLIGLTREQTSQLIALKQDELMCEVSQPKRIREQTVVFRSFRSEITFLNKLGIEVTNGSVSPSTTVDRLRMDNVLKNISSS